MSIKVKVTKILMKIIRVVRRCAVNFNLHRLSANPQKWSKNGQTLKQCLSVFDHFLELAVNRLTPSTSS